MLRSAPAALDGQPSFRGSHPADCDSPFAQSWVGNDSGLRPLPAEARVHVKKFSLPLSGLKALETRRLPGERDALGWK